MASRGILLWELIWQHCGFRQSKDGWRLPIHLGVSTPMLVQVGENSTIGKCNSLVSRGTSTKGFGLNAGRPRAIKLRNIRLEGRGDGFHRAP